MQNYSGPVVAQFIGRFVFVCEMQIEDGICYLSKVRNIRYWSSRKDGLGGLAKDGPVDGDKIDYWPDVKIPIDKLGPVMSANPEFWSTTEYWS